MPCGVFLSGVSRGFTRIVPLILAVLVIRGELTPASVDCARFGVGCRLSVVHFILC